MLDKHTLTLRQADQARGDLYAIQDDLDFLKVQLARIPTRNEIVRVTIWIALGVCVVATAGIDTLLRYITACSSN